MRYVIPILISIAMLVGCHVDDDRRPDATAVPMGATVPSKYGPDIEGGPTYQQVVGIQGRPIANGGTIGQSLTICDAGAGVDADVCWSQPVSPFDAAPYVPWSTTQGGTGQTANGSPGNVLTSDGGVFFPSAPFAGGYANATAIGTIPVWQLSLDMTAADQSTGIVYMLTSLTPGSGGCTAPCANGTWAPVTIPSGGNWTPGASTVATSNITLSGEQTINGFATNFSDVLVVGQTNPDQNGLYTTRGSGAWVYRSDANVSADYAIGKQIAIIGTGSSYLGTIYICNQVPTGSIGASPISFVANSAGNVSFNAASPPAIGNVIANSVSATLLTVDAGEIVNYGTTHPVMQNAPHVTFVNATNWVTIYSYTPTISANHKVDLQFTADDHSGISLDAGLNLDASSDAGGNYSTENSTSFDLVVWSRYLGFPADGGTTGTQLVLLSPGAGTAWSTSTISVPALSIWDCHGCTTLSGGTGCTCSGTTTWSAQALVSDGGVVIQVQATGTTSWPWTGDAVITDMGSMFP